MLQWYIVPPSLPTSTYSLLSLAKPYLNMDHAVSLLFLVLIVVSSRDEDQIPRLHFCRSSHRHRESVKLVGLVPWTNGKSKLLLQVT